MGFLKVEGEISLSFLPALGPLFLYWLLCQALIRGFVSSVTASSYAMFGDILGRSAHFGRKTEEHWIWGLVRLGVLEGVERGEAVITIYKYIKDRKKEQQH